MQPYSSSLSMEEDLLCSLATIASTKHEDATGKEVKQMVMFVATFIDNVPLRDRQKKLDNIEALIKGTDAYNLGMIVCTPLCVSRKGFGSIALDEWSDSDSDFEKKLCRVEELQHQLAHQCSPNIIGIWEWGICGLMGGAFIT